LGAMPPEIVGFDLGKQEPKKAANKAITPQKKAFAKWMGFHEKGFLSTTRPLASMYGIVTLRATAPRR